MTTRDLQLFVLSALGVVLLLVVLVVVLADDAYSQRAFPCQEDEVLGYDARFGPDRVGCLHLEEIAP